MTVTCITINCDKIAKIRGWCVHHYQKFRKSADFDRVRSSNKGNACVHDGCVAQATTKGYCSPHYRAIARQNPELARQHRQYTLWHDRKTAGLLCPEWENDFFAFVKAVGERPSPKHALVRKREGLYDLGNFKWYERLSRQKGESKKDWHARKWQSRKELNPGWDKRRQIYKKYGLTAEQYEGLHDKQDGVCAICKTAEIRVDPNTGSLNALAVDHCHKNGNVRELLCWRCNTTIGKVNESVELLRAMIAYIERHNVPEEST